MTRPLRRLMSAGVVLVAVGLISGCVGGPASLGGAAPLTPTARYALQVEPGLDRIALAVHETGLSATQQAALDSLVTRFVRSGAPDVVIEAPGGGDPAAASMAWGIREALERAGIPAERIRVASYHAPSPRAPVLTGFETVQAVVPRCGTAWGNLGRTGDNRSSANFGCAVTANLAAQISNPRDMIAPRAMTPADASRRAVVFEHYVAGTPTSAQAEARLSDTRISQAVE
ncbi:CpaD family pilus assembly protein [Brevundimonas vesicularis]|uniref:CpaD family pilus assembly protein n=1 Tax=Brevundimonas vesicularis TaxID=41276 RepID=UPI0038D3F038